MRWIARLSLLLLVPGLASAHPGHGAHTGLSAFTHGLEGHGHLLLLLAVVACAAVVYRLGARRVGP